MIIKTVLWIGVIVGLKTRKISWQWRQIWLLIASDNQTQKTKSTTRPGVSFRTFLPLNTKQGDPLDWFSISWPYSCFYALHLPIVYDQCHWGFNSDEVSWLCTSIGVIGFCFSMLACGANERRGNERGRVALGFLLSILGSRYPKWLNYYRVKIKRKKFWFELIKLELCSI